MQVIDQEMTWEEAVSPCCMSTIMDHQIIDSRFINDGVNQIKQPGYAGYLGMANLHPAYTVDKGVINDGFIVSALWLSKTGVFPNGEPSV